MGTARWGIGALLLVMVGVGWLLLRGRFDAAAQQGADETQKATDLPGPRARGSMFSTSWVSTSGKPNQIVHLVNTDLASAIDTVSVEVYEEEGTPTAWTRVTSLKALDPEARVYEAQPLHDGTVLIRFGDGKHGACPPKASRGVRVRHVCSGGQTTTMQKGPIRSRRGVSVSWARGTVWRKSADLLRERAAERIFEVITLRTTARGEAEYKLYEVPGGRLHTFLTGSGDWLAEGETFVSVGVRG